MVIISYKGIKNLGLVLVYLHSITANALMKHLQKLNFPLFSFKILKKDNQLFIYDEIRKKSLLITPEEWVRQHVVKFLNETHNIPLSRINVEKMFDINGRKKRYDVVVYDKSGAINLLVECKKPSIAITQETFDQISQYNLKLNAKYLMITNGIQHIFCNLDFQNERFQFLKELPNSL